MHQSTKIVIISSCLSFFCACGVSADWRVTVGWDELQDWAEIQEHSLPSAESLTIGIVEAAIASNNQETKYMPNPSSSQLSDETIVDATGTNGSEYSGHATGVASKFFGNTGSITPNVAGVNCYGVNGFLSAAAPGLLGSEVVFSHAYVSTGVLSEDDTRFYTAVMDSTAVHHGVLNVVGTNNGVNNSLPQLYSHAFNNLTVGRSDGLHSSGVIGEGYEYPGRQKPEIVNPQSSTSVATGATSSLALFLRAGALSDDAKRPVSIKSILLAGANKLRFPEWSNSTDLPLDSIYGAGETNILNSYRILHAGEQGPGTVTRRGWSYDSVGGIASHRRFDDYTFTVSDTGDYATLSANLSWDRYAEVTESEEIEGNYSYKYGDVVDLSLSLYDSGGTLIYESDNANNNLEHIWQPNLAPGSYRIRVAFDGNFSQNYALAWRVDAMTDSPRISHVLGDGEVLIDGAGLLREQLYSVVRSTDLKSWIQIGSVTSDSEGTLGFVDAAPSSAPEVFYRVRAYPE